MNFLYSQQVFIFSVQFHRNKNLYFTFSIKIVSYLFFNAFFSKLIFRLFLFKPFYQASCFSHSIFYELIATKLQHFFHKSLKLFGEFPKTFHFTLQFDSLDISLCSKQKGNRISMES